MKNLNSSLIATVALLILVATFGLFSCKKNTAKSQIISKDEVKSLANEYLIRKYEILLPTANAQTIDQYYSAIENKATASNEAEYLQAMKKTNDKEQTKIEKVTLNLTVDSLQFGNDDSINALVTEVAHFHTNNISIITGEEIETVLENQYKFKITKRNDGAGFKIEDEILLTTIGDGDNNTVKKNTVKNIAPLNSMAQVSGYYDANKAVSYARKNAYSYGGCTLWFLLNGGDCTDFLSNCLYAGGWPYDNIWYYKYCGPKGASYAWGGADNFRNYALASNRVYSFTPAVLKIGDIISFELTGDGKFDHNTIVSNKDTKGYIYLTYHTSNTLDIKYSDFIALAKKQHGGRTPLANPFSLKSSY